MSPGGGDDINLMDIPRRDGEMDGEEERQKEVQLFQQRIRKGGKPLNIAFIGAAGSGKSSLCNSIMAAFSVGGWREWATVGHFGGHAEQMSLHLLR
jgi:predicted GTPase